MTNDLNILIRCTDTNGVCDLTNKDGEVAICKLRDDSEVVVAINRLQDLIRMEQRKLDRQNGNGADRTKAGSPAAQQP